MRVGCNCPFYRGLALCGKLKPANAEVQGTPDNAASCLVHISSPTAPNFSLQPPEEVTLCLRASLGQLPVLTPIERQEGWQPEVTTWHPTSLQGKPAPAEIRTRLCLNLNRGSFSWSFRTIWREPRRREETQRGIHTITHRAKAQRVLCSMHSC